MAATFPDPVLRAEKVYRRLLNLYPRPHRQEYAAWMAQVFRDVCWNAYRSDGPRGITRVWLKTIPDLTVSALQEYDYEFRRWLMKTKNSTNRIEPGRVMGLLVGAVLIALGLLASVVIREAGGSPVTASMVAVALSLAGAVVMEFTGDRSGAVLGAMIVMLAGYLLPLLWVADADTWLRENPLVGSVIILIAASYRSRYQSNWPLYAAAVIMGGANILISLLN